MGFGKHKHTGMDKTISGGGGYEGIYFLRKKGETKIVPFYAYSMLIRLSMYLAKQTY